MHKKDDKVGNKTTNKEGKRERERKIEINSQKSPKFWLLRMREQQKTFLC